MRIMKLILNQDGDADFTQSWYKAKEFKDVDTRTLNEANLRELYDDEVLLDCESKLQAREVAKKLDKENISYEYWQTGSRGVHISIRINRLNVLNDKERLAYRKHWIKKYNTDMAKINGFLAMENRPHFKTGKYKLLEYKRDGINNIDMNLLVKIKQEVKPVLRLPAKAQDRTTINSIKRNIKISDVLRKMGIDLSTPRVMCPLNHPSKSKKCLHYNDDKGFFYCHNCGAGGDIIKLVMLKYDITFIEALNKMRGWM
jgi:DNA integrity scanning protein DisA with diadenylate cyclase activity